MRILLVLSIALITVSGYKTFAHEVPGDIKFTVEHIVPFFFSTKKGKGSKDISISETKFSQDIAQLVDSINSVNNVRRVDNQTISFDVDGKVHDIQCSLGYFYKALGDCNHKVISFLDCGNNEVVFQNKIISIFYSRISGHSHNPYVHIKKPQARGLSCPEPPLKVFEE